MRRRTLLFAVLSIALTACPASSCTPPRPEARMVPRGGDRVAATASMSSERYAFSIVPERVDAVPVLLFHSVCATECLPDNLYGITQAELGRMLTAIALAGYVTISPEEYVRFLHGERGAIPRQPILLTFDDGRLDAWTGADALLEARGMRATMYVITALADEPGDRYMSWDQIRAAAFSGRWDMQLHAGGGHVRIPAGVEEGAVVERPAYATLRYDRERNATESVAEWKARVADDLAKGDAALSQHVPGYRPWTFAVPFGDYGQKHPANDPAIARELRALFDARYASWFTQPPSPDFATPGSGTHERPRFTILRTTTTEDVYAWLIERATHGAPSPH